MFDLLAGEWNSLIFYLCIFNYYVIPVEVFKFPLLILFLPSFDVFYFNEN